MDISDNAVSLGGLTIGLAIIVWFVVRWWYGAGGKNAGVGQKFKNGWKDLLLPFLPLMLFGSLIILSAGGYLADIGGVALWGTNEVGSIALEQGMGGNSPDVTRTNNIALDDGGRSVVFLMVVAFAAVLAFNKNARRLDLILPVVCGIALGLSDGWAGLASETLAPAVDSLGGTLTGVF